MQATIERKNNMALTNEEIIAALGEKTLLELAELRDMICEEFLADLSLIHI